MLLDGCDFRLRENLHDFLQAYSASPDCHRMLWVDALCIDQENKAERSQQVQLMSKIYSQAMKVIAWLGPAADDSDWCFDRLNDIADRSTISPDDINYKASQYLDSYGTRLRAGVTAILKRPMFSRVWCVQELILPPKVVLMCGTRTLKWDNFQSVANLFTFDFYTDYSRLESLRQTNFDLMKPSQLSKRYERYREDFPTVSQTHERHQLTEYKKSTTQSLENLLRCFIGRQCTIKHDYIYALLGIASDFGPSAHAVKKLTVDYTMPIEDLFDEVITFCGLRYHYEGLFIRKLARAMELSETKMKEVMRKTERIDLNVKPDAKQLQAPPSALEP